MPVDTAHILVVDDDQRLRDLLDRFLTDNGYNVTTAGDADEARASLRGLRFDALVLDRMMPGEDGLCLARDLRTHDATPILLLTAMGEPDERIAGLESGVDDYLVKPFEPRELLLRLGNILRRAANEGPGAGEVVRFGAFRFDPGHRLLTENDMPVRLTEVGSGLLAVLAAAPGQPIARDELAARDGQAGNSRAVDVQITRLRRKIERDPKFPRYLQTVRGMGYMLQIDGVESAP